MASPAAGGNPHGEAPQGIRQGLQDIQPIIDDYGPAPRLSKVLKSIETRYAVPRLGWTAHPQVMTEIERIGSTPEEVIARVTESQPVPALQQRLIAAWLRMPERELFTSQPRFEDKAITAAAAG